MNNGETVRALLRTAGRTYAEQAGIRLTDKPAPLYRLLVLSVLLSTRISADIAVDAAAVTGAVRAPVSTAPVVAPRTVRRFGLLTISRPITAGRVLDGCAHADAARGRRARAAHLTLRRSAGGRVRGGTRAGAVPRSSGAVRAQEAAAKGS